MAGGQTPEDPKIEEKLEKAKQIVFEQQLRRALIRWGVGILSFTSAVVGILAFVGFREVVISAIQSDVDNKFRSLNDAQIQTFARSLSENSRDFSARFAEINQKIADFDNQTTLRLAQAKSDQSRLHDEITSATSLVKSLQSESERIRDEASALDTALKASKDSAALNALVLSGYRIDSLVLTVRFFLPSWDDLKPARSVLIHTVGRIAFRPPNVTSDGEDLLEYYIDRNDITNMGSSYNPYGQPFVAAEALPFRPFHDQFVGHNIKTLTDSKVQDLEMLLQFFPVITDETTGSPRMLQEMASNVRTTYSKISRVEVDFVLNGLVLFTEILPTNAMKSLNSFDVTNQVPKDVNREIEFPLTTRCFSDVWNRYVDIALSNTGK